MAVLQGPVISVMSVGSAHNSLCYRVCSYKCRCRVKTDLGLGAHQGSGEEGRIEQSFGIAVLAYRLLIRACHQEILPRTSWSIAQLQHTLRLRVITNQVEHKVKTRLTKVRKIA